MSDNDSDSDDWGTAELVIPETKNDDETGNDIDTNQASALKDDEADWHVPIKSKAQSSSDVKRTDNKINTSASVPRDSDQSMIIVDLTQIDDKIHNHFDRNSVSDAEAASKLRKKLEGEYEKYSKDTSLLAEGTVIPCGSSVWKDALVRLRDERPGHYFCPIFPRK